MASKRKLWATRPSPTVELKRHESKAAAYREVQWAAGRWQDGILRFPTFVVYVDERDGHGWRSYELIDLREIVASWQVTE